MLVLVLTMMRERGVWYREVGEERMGEERMGVPVEGSVAAMMEEEEGERVGEGCCGC